LHIIQLTCIGSDNQIEDLFQPGREVNRSICPGERLRKAYEAIELSILSDRTPAI
jgi:hypothetical protein